MFDLLPVYGDSQRELINSDNDSSLFLETFNTFDVNNSSFYNETESDKGVNENTDTDNVEQQPLPFTFLLSPPKFSPTSSVHVGSVAVSILSSFTSSISGLSSENSSVTIYYTTDGTLPKRKISASVVNGDHIIWDDIGVLNITAIASIDIDSEINDILKERRIYPFSEITSRLYEIQKRTPKPQLEVVDNINDLHKIENLFVSSSVPASNPSSLNAPNSTKNISGEAVNIDGSDSIPKFTEKAYVLIWCELNNTEFYYTTAPSETPQIDPSYLLSLEGVDNDEVKLLHIHNKSITTIEIRKPGLNIVRVAAKSPNFASSYLSEIKFFIQGQVEIPEIIPSDQYIFPEKASLQILCETTDSKIYYNIIRAGSHVVFESGVVESYDFVSIDSPGLWIIEIVAKAETMIDSQIVYKEIRILERTLKPRFILEMDKINYEVNENTFQFVKGTTVSIASSDESANQDFQPKIYYTYLRPEEDLEEDDNENTISSHPSTKSKVYNSTFEINDIGRTTIRAIAQVDGMAISDEVVCNIIIVDKVYIEYPVHQVEYHYSLWLQNIRNESSEYKVVVNHDDDDDIDSMMINNVTSSELFNNSKAKDDEGIGFRGQDESQSNDDLENLFKNNTIGNKTMEKFFNYVNIMGYEGVQPLVSVQNVQKGFKDCYYCSTRRVNGRLVTLSNPLKHFSFLEQYRGCGHGSELPSISGRDYKLVTSKRKRPEIIITKDEISSMKDNIDSEMIVKLNELSDKQYLEVEKLGCQVVTNAGFFNTTSTDCFGNLIVDTKVVRSTNVHVVSFGIRNGSYVVGYVDKMEILKSIQDGIPFQELISGILWLVRDGKNYLKESLKEEDTEAFQNTGNSFATVQSARTAIGHDKHGKLIILQIEGETWEWGIDLDEMADLLIELGAVNAINLDGGGSATMTLNHTLVSDPSWLCDTKNPKSLFRCEKPVTTISCIHAAAPPVFRLEGDAEDEDNLINNEEKESNIDNQINKGDSSNPEAATSNANNESNDRNSNGSTLVWTLSIGLIFSMFFNGYLYMSQRGRDKGGRKTQITRNGHRFTRISDDSFEGSDDSIELTNQSPFSFGEKDKRRLQRSDRVDSSDINPFNSQDWGRRADH